jgi:hypothetical protein
MQNLKHAAELRGKKWKVNWEIKLKKNY